MNGNNIADILGKFGTSLTETRSMIGALAPALGERKRQAAFPDMPQFFTAADVEEMGLTTETGEPFGLEPGWLLKISPSKNGAEPAFSFITPEKWEILEDQTYISPEGKRFTREEIESQLATPEIPLELEDVFGEVFPKGYSGRNVEETLRWVSESEANLQEFSQTIWELGKTPDTENLLLGLGMTKEEVEEFYTPVPAATITEAAIEAWKETPWLAPPVEWSKAVKGFPGLMDIMAWIAPTKAGASLIVAASYLEKYIGRPWEITILELVARFPVGGEAERKRELGELEKATLQRIEDAFEKYGAAAFFAEEISDTWEIYKEEADRIVKAYAANAFTAKTGALPLTILEWLNPAYFIPIGGTFGLAARWTTKIPLLGRMMRYTAAGVQATEKGITYPAWKPAQLTLQGLEKLGAGLGEKLVNKLIGQSKNLLLEIPASEQIIKGVVVDNWVKRTIQLVAKIPFVRGGVERALGWRVLINREGQLLQDIVGRGAVAYAEIQRMGLNAARWKVSELFAIDANPVKLFGFNKAGYSEAMLKKLLPAYAEQKGIAGTIEHVFTHPEMYSLTEKQLQYVTRVAEINKEVLNLLTKEGVRPQHVIEDWIHRIVTGRATVEGEEILAKGRPGMGGRALGAKPAYEKPRTFETMAEGLAEGYHYDPDITHSVGTYIESAFNKIAAARFEAYVAKFGATPLERLMQRYPSLAEKAALTQTELADAARFGSVINRALRGEKIPEQTLKAMERRFPELGQKLRALIDQPTISAERELRRVIAQNESLIKSLQKRLVKAEKIDIDALKAQWAKEITAGIPDEIKLREAFGLMEYEDRLAFRSTISSQLEDVSRVVAEQEAELAGIREFLSTDPVATFKIHIGKRTVHLDYFIKKGDFPESFTLKEASALMQKRMEAIQTRVISGGVRTNRVPREVVLDNLADHFKMGEEELIDHIQFIATQKITAEDLKVLVKMADDRLKGILRMLGILDDVEARPEFVVKSEAQIILEPEHWPISRNDWEAMSIPERVATAQVAGLEGKVGSKAWGALTASEREALTKARLIPKAPPGMPEAGLQRDFFGYDTPRFPAGKGEVTQISMDDLNKLFDWAKKKGIPVRDYAIKPKVEGIPELAGETKLGQVKFELPQSLTAAQRKVQLEALRNEVRLLTEARKAPYWQARAERAAKMEIVRQPGIGEGYIMQPFAGGKIYSQEFIDTFNKFFGYDRGIGVLKVTSDMAGILRITKASLDFSAMAIQGLPSFGLAHAYMLINPVIGAKLMGRWYQAFGYSVGSFFNPDIFWKYMAKQGASIGQRISFGGSARAIDYFVALEARGGLGGFGAKILKNIPLNPFERAEISFYSAGEIVRDEFWKILSPKALPAGKGFELARHLDLITGLFGARAAGVSLTIRQIESSFMWFAPNYTRACLTVLADIFRGGYTGAMARRALGGLIAAGAAYYTGIQYAISSLEGKSPEEAWNDVEEGFGIVEDPITHEVTWKPTGRFMTLKIGNYYFGVGGFWYGLVRLTGNIMACINEVGDKEVIDLVKILENGNLNRDNPFVYWWYSRSSPLTGTGFEIASGKDFLGYPIETPEQYAKYIATRFEPIWMEQGINWLIPGMARDNEIPEGMAKAAVPGLEMFGLRTFPESQWVKFYDEADKYIQQIPENELDPKQLDAWRKGELGWGELTDIQKANLLARYPELWELYEKAQADSAVRQSKEWEAYQSRTEEERGIYYKRIEELTQQLLRGEIDTREYREKAGEAGANYGAIMEAKQRDPTYAQIYEYFEKKEAEGDEYGFLDNLALAEFQSTILYAEDLIDSKGDYNWDERDRRIDVFIEKWGQDVYDRIQQYLVQQKEEKDLNAVWIRKAEDTEKLGRGYWRLPYKPIIEMDAADEAEGNIPAEYYAGWKAYQALETEAEREAFLISHPDLAKDWRAEYRRDHPEEDARLALWGYGGKLQTMEAYNLVEQWSRELGIPLESMGLGLPPRSLIEDYFGYMGLSLQFSGNSAEAKLWRLEHPEFTNWAMENWGWEGTEDYGGMEYYKLQIQWRSEEAEYNALGDKESRKKYLADHPDYADARFELQALDNEIPEDLIPDYIQYYKLEKPADYEYDSWYEDDWFLMEHKDFYQVMVDSGIWEPRDFSKVPTEAVWELYKTYLGLPIGKPRLDFRVKHPDLDAWLVMAKGYKPATERAQAGAEETPQEKAEKVKRFMEEFG